MFCLAKPMLYPQIPFFTLAHKPKPFFSVPSPISSSTQHPRRRRRRRRRREPSSRSGSTSPRSSNVRRPTCSHISQSFLDPPETPAASTPPRRGPSRGEEEEKEEEKEEEVLEEDGLAGSAGMMWALCGLGYWVQGFRCFPWLGLNFHLAHDLGLAPSTLQLVQNAGNLPMVAKPLFGILSDTVCIGRVRRLPYISIGVFLQLISWGMLAITPVTGDIFPTQMACILLSNLGASLTEVVNDALVAEFSRAQKESGKLQSYAFITLAGGGIFGNLSGGYVLLKTQEPKLMFLTFSFLLGLQLALSLTTKDASAHSRQSLNIHPIRSSVSDNLRYQFSNFVTAINEEKILYPLCWIVASIAVVPVLSGSMFCFQTQHLKLDPSIIGLSKVIGQMMVLSATVLYNRYLKWIPLRRLVFGVQIFYSLSLLSDLFLVKQLNISLGISNEVYVLYLSALAEAVAQFKILPFTVLFSSLCPPGCEGSLFAFFASALCLSSIVSGIFGVGLSTLIGVSSGDYSSLPFGILVQVLAAMLPLGWMSMIPATWSAAEKIVGRR